MEDVEQIDGYSFVATEQGQNHALAPGQPSIARSRPVRAATLAPQAPSPPAFMRDSPRRPSSGVKKRPSDHGSHSAKRSSSDPASKLQNSQSSSSSAKKKKGPQHAGGMLNPDAFMQPPALMDLDQQIDPHQFGLNDDDEDGENGAFFFPDEFSRSYHVPQHFDGYDEYDHDDNPELREMADIQRRYSHATEPRMPQGLHEAHTFLNLPFDHLPNAAGM